MLRHVESLLPLPADAAAPSPMDVDAASPEGVRVHTRFEAAERHFRRTVHALMRRVRFEESKETANSTVQGVPVLYFPGVDGREHIFRGGDALAQDLDDSQMKQCYGEPRPGFRFDPDDPVLRGGVLFGGTVVMLGRGDGLVGTDHTAAAWFACIKTLADFKLAHDLLEAVGDTGFVFSKTLETGPLRILEVAERAWNEPDPWTETDQGDLASEGEARCECRGVGDMYDGGERQRTYEARLGALSALHQLNWAIWSATVEGTCCMWAGSESGHSERQQWDQEFKELGPWAVDIARGASMHPRATAVNWRRFVDAIADSEQGYSQAEVKLARSLRDQPSDGTVQSRVLALYRRLAEVADDDSFGRRFLAEDKQPAGPLFPLLDLPGATDPDQKDTLELLEHAATHVADALLADCRYYMHNKRPSKPVGDNDVDVLSWAMPARCHNNPGTQNAAQRERHVKRTLWSTCDVDFKLSTDIHRHSFRHALRRMALHVLSGVLRAWTVHAVAAEQHRAVGAVVEDVACRRHVGADTHFKATPRPEALLYIQALFGGLVHVSPLEKLEDLGAWFPKLGAVYVSPTLGIASLTALRLTIDRVMRKGRPYAMRKDAPHDVNAKGNLVVRAEPQDFAWLHADAALLAATLVAFDAAHIGSSEEDPAYFAALDPCGEEPPPTGRVSAALCPSHRSVSDALANASVRDDVDYAAFCATGLLSLQKRERQMELAKFTLSSETPGAPTTWLAGCCHDAESEYNDFLGFVKSDSLAGASDEVLRRNGRVMSVLLGRAAIQGAFTRCVMHTRGAASLLELTGTLFASTRLDEAAATIEGDDAAVPEGDGVRSARNKVADMRIEEAGDEDDEDEGGDDDDEDEEDEEGEEGEEEGARAPQDTTMLFPSDPDEPDQLLARLWNQDRVRPFATSLAPFYARFEALLPIPEASRRKATDCDDKNSFLAIREVVSLDILAWRGEQRDASSVVGVPEALTAAVQDISGLQGLYVWSLSSAQNLAPAIRGYLQRQQFHGWDAARLGHVQRLLAATLQAACWASTVTCAESSHLFCDEDETYYDIPRVDFDCECLKKRGPIESARRRAQRREMRRPCDAVLTDIISAVRRMIDFDTLTCAVCESHLHSAFFVVPALVALWARVSLDLGRDDEGGERLDHGGAAFTALATFCQALCQAYPCCIQSGETRDAAKRQAVSHSKLLAMLFAHLQHRRSASGGMADAALVERRRHIAGRLYPCLADCFTEREGDDSRRIKHLSDAGETILSAHNALALALAHKDKAEAAMVEWPAFQYPSDFIRYIKVPTNDRHRKNKVVRESVEAPLNPASHKAVGAWGLCTSFFRVVKGVLDKTATELCNAADVDAAWVEAIFAHHFVLCDVARLFVQALVEGVVLDKAEAERDAKELQRDKSPFVYHAKRVKDLASNAALQSHLVSTARGEARLQAQMGALRACVARGDATTLLHASAVWDDSGVRALSLSKMSVAVFGRLFYEAFVEVVKAHLRGHGPADALATATRYALLVGVGRVDASAVELALNNSSDAQQAHLLHGLPLVVASKCKEGYRDLETLLSQGPYGLSKTLLATHEAVGAYLAFVAAQTPQKPATVEAALRASDCLGDIELMARAWTDDALGVRALTGAGLQRCCVAAPPKTTIRKSATVRAMAAAAAAARSKGECPAAAAAAAEAAAEKSSSEEDDSSDDSAEAHPSPASQSPASHKKKPTVHQDDDDMDDGDGAGAGAGDGANDMHDDSDDDNQTRRSSSASERPTHAAASPRPEHVQMAAVKAFIDSCLEMLTQESQEYRDALFQKKEAEKELKEIKLEADNIMNINAMLLPPDQVQEHAKAMRGLTQTRQHAVRRLELAAAHEVTTRVAFEDRLKNLEERLKGLNETGVPFELPQALIDLAQSHRRTLPVSHMEPARAFKGAARAFAAGRTLSPKPSLFTAPRPRPTMPTEQAQHFAGLLLVPFEALPDNLSKVLLECVTKRTNRVDVERYAIDMCFAFASQSSETVPSGLEAVWGLVANPFSDDRRSLWALQQQSAIAAFVNTLSWMKEASSQHDGRSASTTEDIVYRVLLEVAMAWQSSSGAPHPLREHSLAALKALGTAPMSYADLFIRQCLPKAVAREIVEDKEIFDSTKRLLAECEGDLRRLGGLHDRLVFSGGGMAFNDLVNIFNRVFVQDPREIKPALLALFKLASDGWGRVNKEHDAALRKFQESYPHGLLFPVGCEPLYALLGFVCWALVENNTTIPLEIRRELIKQIKEKLTVVPATTGKRPKSQGGGGKSTKAGRAAGGRGGGAV